MSCTAKAVSGWLRKWHLLPDLGSGELGCKQEAQELADLHSRLRAYERPVSSLQKHT